MKSLTTFTCCSMLTLVSYFGYHPSNGQRTRIQHHYSSKIEVVDSQMFEEIVTVESKSLVTCNLFCSLNDECTAFSKNKGNNDLNEPNSCNLLKTLGNGTPYLPENGEFVYFLHRDTSHELPKSTSMGFMEASNMTADASPTVVNSAVNTTASSDFCSSDCEPVASYLLDSMVVICYNSDVYTLYNDNMCSIIKKTNMTSWFQDYPDLVVTAAVNIGNAVVLLIDEYGNWYFYKQQWNMMERLDSFCTPSYLDGKKFILATRVSSTKILFKDVNGIFYCVNDTVFTCGSEHMSDTNNSSCVYVKGKLQDNGAVAVDQNNQGIVVFIGPSYNYVSKNWEIPSK